MFTFDYLSTTYIHMMNTQHLNGIIGNFYQGHSLVIDLHEIVSLLCNLEAALKRFKVYHHRNGSKSDLTYERVKSIINSELGSKRTERKKKLNQ